MAQDIPVQPSNPWYELTVPLTDSDGSVNTFVFEIRWNFRDKSWYFNLSQDDGTILAVGIRIVLGQYLGRRSTADFFRKGALIAVDTSGQQKEAGFDDIGTRVKLRRFNIYEVILGSGFSLGLSV